MVRNVRRIGAALLASAVSLALLAAGAPTAEAKSDSVLITPKGQLRHSDLKKMSDKQLRDTLQVMSGSGGHLEINRKALDAALEANSSYVLPAVSYTRVDGYKRQAQGFAGNFRGV